MELIRDLMEHSRLGGGVTINTVHIYIQAAKNQFLCPGEAWGIELQG